VLGRLGEGPDLVSAFPLIATPERSWPAFPLRRITIAEIQQKVAENCGLRVGDLTLNRVRNGTIARPRGMAMLLAWELTPHSLKVIGRHFGGRHHSTVLIAARNAKQRCSKNAEADALFKLLRQELAG
jgi:chromosomal replication initiator protein